MHPSISHYRFIERLGAGGMGEVWKAEDLKLQRTVAIKFVAHTLTKDPKSKRGMTHEARAAAAINHPNIATVYEIGEDADRLFIVMEYVEGETLRSRIGQGPFELAAALDVAIQVADALSAAHGRGLIHCDIKDSNVMVTPDGVAKILDFGLAKTRADLSPTPSIGEVPVQTDGTVLLSSNLDQGSRSSTERALAGTLHYLAPEQIRSEQVNGQTDLFSLGVVLYQMLTARHPFDGDGQASVLKSILDAEPRPIGVYREDVPLELESAVRKALEKDRNERYTSAEAMRAKLKAVRTSLETNTFSVARVAASLVSNEEQEQSRPRRLFNRESSDKGRSLVWRFRKWIAAAGVIALLAGALDFLFVQQGAGWSRDLTLSVLAFLCFGAVYAARRRRSIEPTRSTSSGAAFRGLLPFQETDRDRFYGRDVEAAALYDMIAHRDFRFGVLFGESGSGKTSLLRAGLLPKLWEEGYLPIFCRSYKDPLAAALAECRKRSQLDVLQDEPPNEYLRRVSREIGATVVIVCDQLEEFFVSHKSKEERELFLSFIATSHDDSDLPVKFLVSMRSDFLYLISLELGGRIAEPLISSRLFHLRNFDEAQANEIIEKSARRAGLPFEEGLSRHVARDLTSGDVVSPSEMQIVGEQLQSKRIYTIQGYRRAGGKEPLVHSFLEDVIQASGDAEGARLLLRSVISDENTRLTLTVDDIAKRTQRSNGLTERLLNIFVRARLVREIQEDEPWRYELMHEYLIDRINQVTGKVMDATQRANRFLKQYASNYLVDTKTRIPINKLWFIRRYSDVARGERERELIKKSLRWGLVKAGVLSLLLVMGATIAAAALSVSEEWEGVRLSDGHTAAARKAAFSPDGRLLVTCGEDGRIIVWDFARRERLATFNENGGWVNSVAFSPDGKWFATPGANHTVTVWDARRLERAVVLEGHHSMVNVVVFSPDGRLIGSISGGAEGKTLVWDTARWEKVYELPRDVTWGDLVVSPDGRRILIGSQIWDLQTASMTGALDPDPTFAALSPNGSRLIGIDPAGAVSFFDVERLWEKSQFRVLSSQRVHSYHGRGVAFSPDGKLAASAAEDIVLWDAATQKKLVRLKHSAQVWSVAFSPDGRWLVSTHDDGSVLVWDVAERELAASFDGHCASVHSVAFSPDGKRLASAGEDRSAIVWDTESREKQAVLIGDATRITSVAFSCDGERLASSDMDANTILWDLDGRKPEITHGYTGVGGSRASSYCVAVSPDCRFLASTTAVYDCRDGRQVFDLDAMRRAYGFAIGQVYGAAFSPDGKLLACATDNGALTLWDTEKWQLVDKIQLSITPLISVSFAPGGKGLVIGDDDGVVRLWSLNPLRPTAVLGRHSARIKSVCFSPDGSEVASAGDDQTICLWSVRRQALVTRIGTHAAPVLSVAFSPDGKQIACGEHDKSVRLYTRHRSLWGYRLN
ncbi:MAG: protein kinase [Blastocatellia bacterium]